MKVFDPYKFVKLKYRNCEIGVHSLASTYRNVNSWKSKINENYNNLKNFFIGGAIIDSAYYYSRNISAVYIDHGGYMNGLFYKVFSIKKKLIYTNNYPAGFFKINYSIKKNNLNTDYRTALQISKSYKNLSVIEKNKINLYLNKMVNNPEKHISWLINTGYKKIDNNINYKNITHVIYAHSFTDGNLWFGNDGFPNLYDWTVYTINILSKNKKNRIIVKSHPNFFKKQFGEVATKDLQLINQLEKKYNSANIIFIKKPIKNFNLLKKLKKKCIIISHHGTAIIEANHFGFKTICSYSTIWRKNLKISNQWFSKEKYKFLLKKKWEDLKFHKKDDFFDLVKQLYFNPYGDFKKFSYANAIISNIKNFDRNAWEKNRHNHSKFIKDEKLKKKIILKISKNIQERNI